MPQQQSYRPVAAQRNAAGDSRLRFFAAARRCNSAPDYDVENCQRQAGRGSSEIGPALFRFASSQRRPPSLLLTHAVQILVRAQEELAVADRRGAVEAAVVSREFVA